MALKHSSGFSFTQKDYVHVYMLSRTDFTSFFQYFPV